jgi:dTDP-4-dehydrorhamnose 3,5-epimerase
VSLRSGWWRDAIAPQVDETATGSAGMKFEESTIGGVWIIDLEPFVDERGWFARTHCADTFASRGLTSSFSQCSASFNYRRGTLRGLHFQAAPAEEAKLVRCVRGALFDVAVDLRPDSPTCGRWVSVELSADNGRAILIPEGCAHGFQTLTDDAELFYQISVAYRPELSRGVRWDDPVLDIPWPIEAPVVSERDRALPTLGEVLDARRSD